MNASLLILIFLKAWVNIPLNGQKRLRFIKLIIKFNEILAIYKGFIADRKNEGLST